MQEYTIKAAKAMSMMLHAHAGKNNSRCIGSLDC